MPRCAVGQASRRRIHQAENAARARATNTRVGHLTGQEPGNGRSGGKKLRLIWPGPVEPKPTLLFEVIGRTARVAAAKYGTGPIGRFRRPPVRTRKLVMDRG